MVEIEGFKISIPGGEVKRLLVAKAAYHRSRMAHHQEKLAKFSDLMNEEKEQDRMSSSTRDPREHHRDRLKHHTDRAKEDDFLAQFVNVEAMFLLDTSDLHRLGVLSSRY